jgi:hypothetical protein
VSVAPTAEPSVSLGGARRTACCVVDTRRALHLGVLHPALQQLLSAWV